MRKGKSMLVIRNLSLGICGRRRSAPELVGFAMHVAFSAREECRDSSTLLGIRVLDNAW
jgi:hypothetical protein